MIRSGKPASPTVGTSGRTGSRIGAVTARARNLPVAIRSAMPLMFLPDFAKLVQEVGSLGDLLDGTANRVTAICTACSHRSRVMTRLKSPCLRGRSTYAKDSGHYHCIPRVLGAGCDG